MKMRRMQGLAWLIAGSVIAVSSAQAALSVVSGAFTVDLTPPEAPQLIAPAVGATIALPSTELAALATDATSGVVAYRFEVNGALSDWQPAGTFQVVALALGRHEWRVQARDAAGHDGPWSDTGVFLYWPGEDSDGDGLPDAWEWHYFGSLTFTDGTADSDGDGVSDADEFLQGTHPFEFYVDLAQGWNIVALPFDATEDGVAALRALSPAPFWKWNGHAYAVVPLPEAYEGFWVYLDAAQTAVPISGMPAVETAALLDPLWNLAGAGHACRALNSAVIRVAWDWQGSAYVPFAPESVFGDFRGYWIFTRDGGWLEFGPPEEGE